MRILRNMRRRIFFDLELVNAEALCIGMNVFKQGVVKSVRKLEDGRIEVLYSGACHGVFYGAYRGVWVIVREREVFLKKR